MKKLVYDMVNFKDKTTGEYLSFPTLKGDKGDTGKSAYESAVELGFTGTEAEWLESLKYVSSPEYDTLLASLTTKEQNAVAAAATASEKAQATKDYYDLISGLKGFEIVILEDGEYTAEKVPSIANPKDSTFYLVPSGNNGNNNYNEYIYVNNAWEMVGAKEVDLTNYVVRSELNAYVANSVLADYATTASLANYATTASLNDYAKAEDLDNYAAVESLSAYATTASLSDYAKSADLNDYAKLEDLDNYATVESLSAYATTATLDDYATTESLGNYATTASLSAYAKSSDLNNYATTAALADYATTAALSEYAKSTDLDSYTATSALSANYALKTELPTAEEKNSWNAKYELPETGILEEDLSTEVRVKLNSFFEADPVDKDLLEAYALKTELLDYTKKTDLKDYATTASLSNYATTASLSNYATTASLGNYATTAALADYATTGMLSDYATTASLGDYATTESLSAYVPAETLSDYATTASLSAYATNESLSAYVQNSTLDDYATTESLSAYAPATALDDYALVTALDDYTPTSALSANYALKTELSTAEKRDAWDAKYDKPEDGIPLTDLSQDVQDVINDPKIEVDTTLTVEGAAADAKITGEILSTKVGPEEIVKFIQWDNAVDGMTMSTTTNMVIMKEEEYEKLKVKVPNAFYFIYDDAEEAEAYDL